MKICNTHFSVHLYFEQIDLHGKGWSIWSNYSCKEKMFAIFICVRLYMNYEDETYAH